MLCDQDFTTATAIQRQMYTALNEVAELTDQLSQAVDRQDQVAVRMFLSMRLEEIQRLTGYQALLDRQCDQLAPEDRGVLTQMNSGRFGGEAPSPSAQALLQQAQRNRTVLERVRRVDEAVSRRLGGNSSFYLKNSK